jgi:glycosyltransferase involved in cell wall biosynthesis
MGLSDRVHLVGHRDNPYPILRQADALVLTSEFEAFALVLVEAMVCGVPVLAVDCPFGPSEVLEGGRHGLLVPPGDPEAFATAMERIATDERLRQDLVASGYERALDYDVARIVRQWQKLIDETASATS